jgi:hypothetical protein
VAALGGYTAATEIKNFVALRGSLALDISVYDAVTEHPGNVGKSG